MRAAGAAVLILLIASTASVRADYAAEFRQGVLASDRKEWSEVVRHMQAAIVEKPAESRNRVLIYGVHYEPYVPHLWLGVAYSNLNDCDTALKELAESEKQVEVTKTTRYRDLQITSYQCQKRVAAKLGATAPPREPSEQTITALTESAQEQIDAATRLAQQIRQKASDPATQPLWNSDAGLADRLAQASLHVDGAKRRLSAARSTKNASEISGAGDTASIARGELE